MFSRNARFYGMFDNREQSLYCVCGRIDFQQYNERSNLHNLCSSLCSWIHLSIHRLYGIYKSYLHSV